MHRIRLPVYYYSVESFEKSYQRVMFLLTRRVPISRTTENTIARKRESEKHDSAKNSTCHIVRYGTVLSDIPTRPKNTI